MPPLPRASVLVCTRNRSRVLADACEAILAIDYPAGDWELLILDNGSTDDTLQVAHEVAARHPRQVSVHEHRPIGLSGARNAGIRLARGEIVAFIDDDAFPAPEWLRGLEEAFAQPNVYAAGGPVDPLFTGELPDWLAQRYLPYLSVWDLGSDTLDLAYNEYPRGTNLAFRRAAFDRFGVFSPQLGRKGKSLLSGEEVELCLRIERGGGRILYTPKSRVRHRIDASRITPEWLAQRFAAQGRTEAIIDWRHGGFAALRCGCRRLRRYFEEAQQEIGPGADLYRTCMTRSYRAYIQSALTAPLTIQRYRPGPEAGPLKPWLPFS